MKEYIEERAVQIANYIIDENATVRQTAKKFGISKSTVHKDVTDRLTHINPALAAQARVVLGEWSDGALKICRQNVRRNSLTARVVPMQADAREKPEKSLGEFQCIVSNPPYIPRADIETLDTSVMLITHDLGVVREVCSRAIIFYCGQVIEEGPVEELFENPCHPYTQGLLKSLPVMGSRDRLYVIPGTVPSPGNLPEGCVFNPRCGHATEKCRNCRPQMTDISDGHCVRCWLYDKEG